MNKPSINQKVLTAALLSALSLGSASALAELYVSPVLRDTVTYKHQDGANEPQSTSSTGLPDNIVVTGSSSVHGDFVMRKDQHQALRFGDNVPLFIALENIIPNAKQWSIKIDDGLENTAISWNGGNTWEGTLKAIEQENGISIAINNNEKAVGVGLTPDIAIALASKDQRLWRLESKKSLRVNLESWVKNSDWNLYWDESIANVDYPVVADAPMKGKLDGKGGVADRILNATQRRKVPLAADFYYGNKLIHVRPAGYEQEVKF
jgi:hypothetical protein